MSKTVTPARYRLFHDHANQVGKATLKPLSAVSEVVKPANSLFMITTAGPIDLIGCESTPGSDGYMYPITEAIENGKVDWVRNASSYNLTKATLIGPASMRLRHSHGTLLLMDPPTFKYPRRFILRYRSDCDPEPSPFKRAFLSKMCASLNKQAYASRKNNALFRISPNYERTPTCPLPLDHYLPDPYIVQLLYTIYESPENGQWCKWASENPDHAKLYFSQPYSALACETFGYYRGAANPYQLTVGTVTERGYGTQGYEREEPPIIATSPIVPAMAPSFNLCDDTDGQEKTEEGGDSDGTTDDVDDNETEREKIMKIVSAAHTLSQPPMTQPDEDDCPQTPPSRRSNHVTFLEIAGQKDCTRSKLTFNE